MAPNTPESRQEAPVSEHPAEQPDLGQDLADLRYLWGGTYRITWQNRFQATHIATTEHVSADTAADLHICLWDHFRRTRNSKDRRRH